MVINSSGGLIPLFTGLRKVFADNKRLKTEIHFACKVLVGCVNVSKCNKCQCASDNKRQQTVAVVVWLCSKLGDWQGVAPKSQKNRKGILETNRGLSNKYRLSVRVLRRQMGVLPKLYNYLIKIISLSKLLN